MFSDARRHVIYRVANAPLRSYPFAHLVVDDVFPRDVAAQMRAMLPDDGHYRPLVETGRVGRGYSDRRLALFPDGLDAAGLDPARRAFWAGIFAMLLHEDFGAWILAKFYDTIAPRLGLEDPAARMELRAEAFLMRDRGGYSLGPHTDSPAKVASVLVYLAGDDDDEALGTALYLPRDPDFVCAGGPHHCFDRFDRVTTLPYRANMMVAFPKTDRCFHGVEPVATGRRDVLLFDLKLPP